MAGSTQREAKKQIEDKRLRQKHLGKIPLKHRLIEFAKGSHNNRTNKSGRGMETTIAKEKERTKLARLMEERQKSGARARTKARRKVKGHSKKSENLK